MRINIILTFNLLIPFTVFAQVKQTEINKRFPVVDDPKREWSYLAKSTTVIGIPFQSDVTQVTYDGALYTRNAELCFFYGKDNKPLMARQKNFFAGWIPIVGYIWDDENIQYEIEMFAASINGKDTSNSINFVRLKVKNIGKRSAEYRFTTALRGRLNDYRFGNFNGNSTKSLYSMAKDNSVSRDGQLVYISSPGGKKLAIPGIPYSKPFLGKDYSLTEQSPACLTTYDKRLKPGETVTLVFKMPRVPISGKNKTFLKQVQEADYNNYRKKTVTYWRTLLEKDTRYEIPEKRVEDAQKASMVHLLLATRTMSDGNKTQTDGLPYPMFFLTSAAQNMLAYLSYGQFNLAKLIVLNAVKQQEDDGLYFDRSLAHGGTIPAAHGHILFVATSYYLQTQDKTTANVIYPSIKKAIAYLEKAIKDDQYGLLPPAYPYDNEMIDGHYTSNNLWALLGLRYSIRLAKDLGYASDFNSWVILEKKYRENILKGVKASAKTDGYVPPGLYPYLTGQTARRGFMEYQTNCDWENMLLSYPTELFSPHDDHVSGTLNQVRKSYAEGIMTYRHGQHLHQYITANMIEQYMVRGNAQQALIDFYNLLVHSGSTHEEFENLVEPWKDRQVSEECPPPHAWASAKTASLIRNFLVHEYGGEAGLDKEKRDLYLFSVISPEWAKAGKHISAINVPTEMGMVSAKIGFFDRSAEVEIHADYRTQPGAVRIRIPYFKKLISFTTDAKHSSTEDGCIVLSPDVHKVSILWEENQNSHRGTVEELLTGYRDKKYLAEISSSGVPIIKQEVPFLLQSEKSNKSEPLSFELVKNTFLYEFNRRTKK